MEKLTVLSLLTATAMAEAYLTVDQKEPDATQEVVAQTRPDITYLTQKLVGVNDIAMKLSDPAVECHFQAASAKGPQSFVLSGSEQGRIQVESVTEGDKSFCRVNVENPSDPLYRFRITREECDRLFNDALLHCSSK